MRYRTQEKFSGGNPRTLPRHPFYRDLVMISRQCSQVIVAFTLFQWDFPRGLKGKSKPLVCAYKAVREGKRTATALHSDERRSKQMSDAALLYCRSASQAVELLRGKRKIEILCILREAPVRLGPIGTSDSVGIEEGAHRKLASTRSLWACCASRSKRNRPPHRVRPL